jgi:hypothetical protein
VLQDTQELSPQSFLTLFRFCEVSLRITQYKKRMMNTLDEIEKTLLKALNLIFEWVSHLASRNKWFEEGKRYLWGVHCFYSVIFKEFRHGDAAVSRCCRVHGLMRIQHLFLSGKIPNELASLFVGLSSNGLPSISSLSFSLPATGVSRESSGGFG